MLVYVYMCIITWISPRPGRLRLLLLLPLLISHMRELHLMSYRLTPLPPAVPRA